MLAAQQQQQLSYNFKVVLLGEGCVGKTSLVLRYVDDRFNPNHVTTLQASFLAKKLNIGGKRVSLSIWDTAGQERFHALGPIYYRSSNGALLVYDVTDEDSFRKVKNWVKELKRQLGTDIVLTIVGNKIDLQANVIVPPAEAEAYALSVGARHFHTSAKDNVGVEELFYELATMMIDTADAKQARLLAERTAGQLRRSNSRRAASGGLMVEGAMDGDDGTVNMMSEAATQSSSGASRCCGSGGGGGGDAAGDRN